MQYLPSGLSRVRLYKPDKLVFSGYYASYKIQYIQLSWVKVSYGYYKYQVHLR